MDNKDKRYITSIEFRTCDYDDAHHIKDSWEQPITYGSALEYIRHWALDLITDLKINGKSTGWNLFREYDDDIQREEKNS